MACKCCERCPTYYRGHRIQIYDDSKGLCAEVVGDLLFACDIKGAEDYEVHAKACARIDQAIAEAEATPPADARLHEV